MSAITPEEEAGYTRFTVVLPTDVVKKLDLLKAYGGLDNRNRVIFDAAEILYDISTMLANIADTKDPVLEQNLDSALRSLLIVSTKKYWLAIRDLRGSQSKHKA